MNFDIRGPGEGKTRDLIKIAHDTNKLIVVRNYGEARRVFKEALNSGYNIHLPITVSEFIDRRYYPLGVESLLLDSVVETLLEKLSLVPIEVVTMRGNTK